MSGGVVIRSGGVRSEELFALRVFCFEGDMLTNRQAEQSVLGRQSKSTRDSKSRQVRCVIDGHSLNPAPGSRSVPEQTGVVAEHLLVY